MTARNASRITRSRSSRRARARASTPSDASTTSTAGTSRTRRRRSRVAESLLATRTVARGGGGLSGGGVSLTGGSWGRPRVPVKCDRPGGPGGRRRAARRVARRDSPSPRRSGDRPPSLPGPAAISADVRATKFHHMRTASPKGAPPMSRRRRGPPGAANATRDRPVPRKTSVSGGRADPSTSPVPRSSRTACSNDGSSGQVEVRAALDGDVGPHDRREDTARRPPVAQPAEEHRGAAAVELERGQVAVVLEGGLDLSVRVRQGHPELHALEAPAVDGRRLLRVGDPAARGHEVERPRPPRGLEAERVAVEDLAVEQPRDRLQADVRVRGHVHRLPAGERQRAERVQEAPGPHETAPACRQEPADRQVAQERRAAGQKLERGAGCGRARAALGRRGGRGVAHPWILPPGGGTLAAPRGGAR